MNKNHIIQMLSVAMMVGHVTPACADLWHKKEKRSVQSHSRGNLVAHGASGQNLNTAQDARAGSPHSHANTHQVTQNRANEKTSQTTTRSHYPNREEAFIYTPGISSSTSHDSLLVQQDLHKNAFGETREWQKQAIAQGQANHPASYVAREKKTLIEKAQERQDLTTFLAAVEALGLTDQLKFDGPYTLFAPSNEAFKKLPRGSLERLLKPENERQLYHIISLHIVPGKIRGKDTMYSSLRTLGGKDISITFEKGVIQVDDAQVVTPDIKSSNGVIHIIDHVMLPSDES